MPESIFMEEQGTKIILILKTSTENNISPSITRLSIAETSEITYKTLAFI